MTEPAPDTITEPDTVSGETPAWEPDAVAAETVVTVEPAPVQEPDATPADPVAAVEPDPLAAEPAAAAVEPERAREPDAIPAIDNPYPGPVAAEVSQRVIDEINDADQTGTVVIANGPVTDEVAAAERPSNIVEQFNDRFGDIPWEDRDKILQAVTEEIPAKVAADEAYRNAVAFSDRQNSEIEHSFTLQKVVLTYLTTNMELFKQFQDNPAFRTWLTDVNFATTYEQMVHRENQGKDATIITNADLDRMTLKEARDEASTLSPDSLPPKPEPVEPDTIAEPDTVSGETPAREPDAVAAETVVAVEPAPVQEPEYAAAAAMTEPEPDTIAEPDTVSGETPAWQPDAVAAETVVTVEPDLAQEPDAVPVDPAAEIEPEPVELQPIADPTPELESRLRYCEVTPTPETAARVPHFVQQDLAQSRQTLEIAAAQAGLPSLDQLPENVERLELLPDGSVVAVTDDSYVAPEPSDIPDVAETPEVPETPDADGTDTGTTVGDGLPSVMGDAPDTTADAPDTTTAVNAKPRWEQMTQAEKQAAIDRYNKALEAYRLTLELAQMVQREDDAGDLVELYCDYLRERLGESQVISAQRTTPAISVEMREPYSDPTQTVALSSPAANGAEAHRQVEFRPAAAMTRGKLHGIEITPLEPEPVAAGRVSEAPGKTAATPAPIEYRPGQAPVALGESPDDPMVAQSKKRHRRGRRKPDEEEHRGAPEINLVVRAG